MLRLFLSSVKKTFLLLSSGKIQLSQFAGTCKDMYNCGRYYQLGTNTYISRQVYLMHDEEKKIAFLAENKQCVEKSQVRKRQYDEYVTRLWGDKKFFAKWTSMKYDVSSKMQSKRCQAYRKRFNMPDDSFVGPNVVFRCSHYLEDYTPFLKIGHNVMMVENVFVDWTGKVTIEDNVTLTNGVVIESHARDMNAFREGQDINIPSELNIGKGAYIGSRAIILSTCHQIGENATVAANAVVTKDVPANSLVAGVPAKVIKIYSGD